MFVIRVLDDCCTYLLMFTCVLLASTVILYWTEFLLRHCELATSKTKVFGTHVSRLPSDQTMALGSTQPLVKMSTRNFPGGKGGRCVRLTTYHHTVPLSRNLGALTSLDPSGPARPVTGALYLYLYLYVSLEKFVTDSRDIVIIIYQTTLLLVLLVRNRVTELACFL